MLLSFVQKDSVFDVSIPIRQRILCDDVTRDVLLYAGSNDKNVVVNEDGYWDNIHGIKLYSASQNVDINNLKNDVKSLTENGDIDFVGWFSPERLLYLILTGTIKCNDSISDIASKVPKTMLTYEVLYIGEATKQSIYKRLQSHSNLQKILSLENPEDKFVTDDLVILLLKKEGYGESALIVPEKGERNIN